MQLERRWHDAAEIFTLTGDLVLGGPELELRSETQTALEDGRSLLVLDLSGIVRIDSAGIGELISCLKQARKCNARLVLLRPSRRVRDALLLCGLDQLIEMYVDEAEAVRQRP